MSHVLSDCVCSHIYLQNECTFSDFSCMLVHPNGYITQQNLHLLSGLAKSPGNFFPKLIVHLWKELAVNARGYIYYEYAFVTS